ncbi:MAG: 16S rRNA (guanine(527)-N(7))-methyltransferase RsmG [Acidimicrobiales bacterium]
MSAPSPRGKSLAAGWCWNPLPADDFAGGVAGGTLAAVLEQAKALGLLGPGEVSGHLAHAAGFAAAVESVPSRIVDLGSGAGVPGLVLARTWPSTTVVLVDSSARRAAFLREAVADLDLAHVDVVEERAERLGRVPRWRGWAEVVVARSFGSPGVTAECAAPLVAVGGLILVSEPPVPDITRWPTAGLATLGLCWIRQVECGDSHVAVLRQVGLCPDRFPRRVGIPTKRPIF